MTLIKNATVYTMAQKPFVGDLRMENGKITEIGTTLADNGATVIDGSGKYLLPGIVDAHCHIGMWEDGMGFEGSDGNEATDPVTPSLRAIDAINPEDVNFKEAREHGVTTVVTGPGSANVVGGTFVALKTLPSQRVDDMVIMDPVALKCAFGENPKRVYSGQKKAPSTRMATADLLRKTLVKGQNYMRKLEAGAKDADKMPDRDMDMEIVVRVLKGEIPLKAHAHRTDDILTALRIAKEFGVKITLEHCTEGYLIADILADENVPITIGPLLSERSKIELRNMTFKAPGVMEKAGIPFALMTDHPVIPVHYLMVCAGLAVREGCSEKAALRAITIHAAKAAGLDDRIGSLELGKDADMALYDGHPLDTRTHVTNVWINGESVFAK